jgi:integrase/recombinase XerD
MAYIGYMISQFKLVEIAKDSIQPLSTGEVKKILKILDLANYAEYRGFCMMLVMLETGIRVNEACNIMVADINKKIRLLTVRSKTAKTREERNLPISAKTMKYLERLINIAETNSELYLFNYLYGGKLETLSVIKNFEKYGKKAGMDIFTLQKLLGHNNITTTRQYIQLDTDDLISSHSKANVINKFI